MNMITKDCFVIVCRSLHLCAAVMMSHHTRKVRSFRVKNGSSQSFGRRLASYSIQVLPVLQTEHQSRALEHVLRYTYIDHRYLSFRRQWCSTQRVREDSGATF